MWKGGHHSSGNNGNGGGGCGMMVELLRVLDPDEVLHGGTKIIAHNKK